MRLYLRAGREQDGLSGPAPPQRPPSRGAPRSRSHLLVPSNSLPPRPPPPSPVPDVPRGREVERCDPHTPSRPLCTTPLSGSLPSFRRPGTRGECRRDLACLPAPTRFRPSTGPALSSTPPPLRAPPSHRPRPLVAAPIRPAFSPEPVAEAAVGPQGLGEAEIEEAVLGHHVSQEPHGRLAQVPLPKEVFLGTARPGSGPRQARPAGSVPIPGRGRGAAPRGISRFSVGSLDLDDTVPPLVTDEGIQSPERGVSSLVRKGGGGKPKPGIPGSCLLTPPAPKPQEHPPCPTPAQIATRRPPLTRSVCLSNFIIAFLQPSVRRSLMACVGQADGAELWGQDQGGPAHFSCPRLPVYCSHSSQDVAHAVPSALPSTATQCLPLGSLSELQRHTALVGCYSACLSSSRAPHRQGWCGLSWPCVLLVPSNYLSSGSLCIQTEAESLLLHPSAVTGHDCPRGVILGTSPAPAFLWLPSTCSQSSSPRPGVQGGCQALGHHPLGQLRPTGQWPVPRPPSGPPISTPLLLLPHIISAGHLSGHRSLLCSCPGSLLPPLISALSFVHLASPRWPGNSPKEVSLHSHSPFPSCFPRLPKLGSARAQKRPPLSAHP